MSTVPRTGDPSAPAVVPVALSTRRARRWLRACVVVSAVCQLAWLGHYLVPSDLVPRDSYVSELLARDQPFSRVLRAVDGLGGAAALAGAVGAAVLLARRGADPLRARRTGAVALLGLAVFGATTLVDSLSPMTCAPSASPDCAAAEHAGELPPWHYLHTVSSSVAVAGAAIGLGAVAVLLWRDSVARPGRRLAFTLAVAGFLLATAWTLAEIAAATGALPELSRVLRTSGAVGWAQRVQVTLCGVALALLGLFLRPPRGEAGR